MPSKKSGQSHENVDYKMLTKSTRTRDECAGSAPSVLIVINIKLRQHVSKTKFIDIFNENMIFSFNRCKYVNDVDLP